MEAKFDGFGRCINANQLEVAGLPVPVDVIKRPAAESRPAAAAVVAVLDAVRSLRAARLALAAAGVPIVNG